jgi:endonuclease/exonuclease/phosphatase (EEP) superfamily protein YafD
VNVVLVAVLLTWAAPELRWWSDGPELAGPSYVVATSNIAGDHHALDESAEVVTAIEADVLTVVELTPDARAALADAGVAERYPYRTEDPQHGAFGSGIYSRHPILDADVLDLAGARMARAVVDLPSGPTTVIAVHTMQPLTNLDDLRAQVASLRDVVESTDGPVILAGDFNATRAHQPFRSLLEAGLADAHLATGSALSASWPVGVRVPPFALIDHVLVSDQLAVAEVREVDVPASDHRALVAVVGSAARAVDG